MTSDNPSTPDDAAVQPAGAVPSGTTGQGGPQQRQVSADTPASASRPSRAPHLGSGRAGTAVTDEAAPQRAIVTRAQRRRARRMELTRRQLMRTSFWGVFTFGLTGALAAFMAFFWPRGVQGFGGKIAVAASLVPEVGSPPRRLVVGKFWLSNLRTDECTHAGFGELGGGGLLALWQKCPHLGCTVPWDAGFNFEGVTGWFRCPCHGSTYTKAGIRVFGPAPRPLDSMQVTVNDDGSLTVDSGAITKGGTDNPVRAVPYNL